jgi:TonB-linked SusC/RagA family outer membrane protein
MNFKANYHRRVLIKKTLLFMKMTIVLLFSACLAASAGGFAQRVTLSANNVKIEKIFKEIEKQTGYVFFYEAHVLQETKRVSIDVRNETVGEALKEILRGEPVDFSILRKTVFIVKKKNQYETTNSVPVSQPEEDMRSAPVNIITGSVRDAQGNALIGVSVIVKGTQKGTSTGTDGSFSINANVGDVLEFSIVGYQKKSVTVSANKNLSIVMEIAATKGDEVVVVGYTSKQLSKISSSVSVVSGEELNTVTSNDVGKLLQGKAPGVVVSNTSGDPNVSSSVVIRGTGSITANAAPLYVVDGIIGGTANPSDIESVTILKDAAATGLYGSRASNGVIIITTKSGKSGKTKIQLSSTTGISKVSTGHFQLMNSQQLYDFQKSFFPANLFASLRPDSLLKHNTDWQDLAFRTGLVQNYTLSVSGGTEKTHFYVAGNYYNEDGTLRLNGRKVYNFRTNFSHKISSKLKLGIRMDVSSQNAENEASGGYGALYGSYTNMPWDPAYNPDGSITTGNEPGWIGREHDNFLFGQQYNYNQSRVLNVTGDITLEYSIIPNLTLSTYNRISYRNEKDDLYYDVRTRPGAGLGQLYNGINYQRRLITSNRIHFDKHFDKHSISVIAVGEAETNYSDINNLYGSTIPAGLHVMEAAAFIGRPTASPGSISENSYTKGLAQFDYNFDNRYFGVVSYINESSSRFGADNRSANFYTLAGSWIVSNEAFMRNQSIFEFLKLRASYGITGNANIQDYQSLGLYNYSYQYDGYNAAVPFQLANNNLTWEKAKTLDFGLDIGIAKRISVNLDWYDKTTEGLLLNVQLPYTSGYSSVLENVGSIQNRGIEINVTSKNFNGGVFKWETRINIAFNRNKVLTLYDGQDLTNGSQRISEGRDLYSWYLRKWVGVDPENGDPLWEVVTTDANGNKKITTTNNYNSATLQFVGTASPDFTGGINNTLSYKNFSLSAYANFVSGVQVLNAQRAAFDNDGASTEYNSIVLFDGWSRWEKPGDIATHPKPVYGGNKNAQQGSSRYMENGSYIRLQNVTLGYELPSKFLERIKIDNAKIFISGDNLWTGTHFSSMDPEAPLSGGGVGYSNIKYPISKKISFGLNVGF